MTVQFEYALDSKKQVVFIGDVNHNDIYTCLNKECGAELIPKRGNKRAYHFAHKNIEFSHQGESKLHYNTKYLIHTFINRCILESIKFNIEYISLDRNYMGSIDLLEGVHSVRLETHVNHKYRPDISVYDINNNVLYCIEIVKSHDISDAAYNIINDEKIPVVKIYIDEILYSYLKKCILNSSNSVSIWSDDTTHYDIINFKKAEEFEKTDRLHLDEVIHYQKEIDSLNNHINMSKQSSYLLSKQYLDKHLEIENLRFEEKRILDQNESLSETIRFEEKRILDQNESLDDELSLLNSMLSDTQREQRENILFHESTKQDLIKRTEYFKKQIVLKPILEHKPIVCDVHSGGVICYFKNCKICPCKSIIWGEQ